MSNLRILFGFLFLVCLPAMAQVNLETGDTDYMRANGNFQERPYRPVSSKKVSATFYSPPSGIHGQWYSCSDTLARLYPDSFQMKVVVVPGGPNCFGLQVNPPLEIDTSFWVLHIQGYFESRLPMDSLRIDLALSDEGGNSTGFGSISTWLFRKESGRTNPVFFLSWKSQNESPVPMKGRLSDLSFQVRSPLPEGFWGSVHIQSVRAISP